MTQDEGRPRSTFYREFFLKHHPISFDEMAKIFGVETIKEVSKKMGNKIVIGVPLYLRAKESETLLTFDQHSEFHSRIDSFLSESDFSNAIIWNEGRECSNDILGNHIKMVNVALLIQSIDGKGCIPSFPHINELNEAAWNYLKTLPNIWVVYIGMEGFDWK